MMEVEFLGEINFDQPFYEFLREEMTRVCRAQQAVANSSRILHELNTKRAPMITHPVKRIKP
jgi:hypothetical protein